MLMPEQGITGDVLAVLDQSALIDLGMTSVGHRLNLLRAVWELKKEQGVEFGEDDWQPQSEFSRDAVSTRLFGMAFMLKAWRAARGWVGR